jgi:hypothetical protein
MRILAFITDVPTVRIFTHPPRPTSSTSASPGSRIVDRHPRAPPGRLAPTATMREPQARRRTWGTRAPGKNAPTATPNHSVSPPDRSRQLPITRSADAWCAWNSFSCETATGLDPKSSRDTDDDSARGRPSGRNSGPSIAATLGARPILRLLPSQATPRHSALTRRASAKYGSGWRGSMVVIFGVEREARRLRVSRRRTWYRHQKS